MTSDTKIRQGLAEVRQSLWRELSELPPLDKSRRSLSRRVVYITRQLNGHAHDIHDRMPTLPESPWAGYATTGGLFEQKRHDRVELEVKLQTHQFFLDNSGRRRR